MEAEARRRAMKGVERPVLYAGKKCGTIKLRTRLRPTDADAVAIAAAAAVASSDAVAVSATDAGNDTSVASNKYFASSRLGARKIVSLRQACMHGDLTFA